VNQHNFMWFSREILKNQKYQSVSKRHCSKPLSAQVKLQGAQTHCTYKRLGCSSGKADPQGSILLPRQDFMQKLKWCLLWSAVAELFNKLMENLLFVCEFWICFLLLSVLLTWSMWARALDKSQAFR